MDSTKEIVTLQFGAFANHVAAHYWNLEYENTDFGGNSVKSESSTANRYPVSGGSTSNPYKDDMHLHKAKDPQYSSTLRPTPASRTTAYSERKEVETRLSALSSSNQTGEHRNINPSINFFSNSKKSRTLGGNNISEKSTSFNYVPRTIVFAMNGEEGNILESAATASEYQSQSGSDPANVLTWDK
ncbi:hypothetical protein RFI_12288, partial [Reticulomyxa filosa]